MKCSKCKKKLQTKRTLDDNTETKREKFCGKCKITFETVEMFAEDIDNNINETQTKIEELVRKYDRLETSYTGLRDALHLIIKAGQGKQK